MDCLPSTLPEGPEWTYEIKLDGYRLEAVRTAGRTTLYSRRQNILNQKFHHIATALKELPDDTVIDGELVALAPMVGLKSTFCRTSAPPKRSDSVYQPGQRSGLWSKYRVNLGQEFVVGGVRSQPAEITRTNNSQVF
jgi:ATP-dependent DNA ligase